MVSYSSFKSQLLHWVWSFFLTQTMIPLISLSNCLTDYEYPTFRVLVVVTKTSKITDYSSQCVLRLSLARNLGIIFNIRRCPRCSPAEIVIRRTAPEIHISAVFCTKLPKCVLVFVNNGCKCPLCVHFRERN